MQVSASRWCTPWNRRCVNTVVAGYHTGTVHTWQHDAHQRQTDHRGK